MNLFLLRHGIAVDHGAPGIKKDSDRPLTDEGIAQMHEITDAMRKLNLHWDVILSSPFIRARQTAEITAEDLGLKKKLKFSEHLASGANTRKVIEEINREYQDAENILLVGHEPDLSNLISMLVTGRLDSDFIMKKAGLCKLQTGALDYKKCACLKWLVTPKQLCAMAS